MANLKRASKLLEDMTCPICMEILQNPVTIDCGHNFCLQCINQVGKTKEILHCPLCQLPVNKNAFRPNKLLASLAENIQAMNPAEFQPEEEEPRCRKHKENYHYFCEKDGEFLCVVCRDSKDHNTHRVTLIDEFAQNYKVGTCLLLCPQLSRVEFPGDVGAAVFSIWLAPTAALLTLELAVCSWVQ